MSYTSAKLIETFSSKRRTTAIAGSCSAVGILLLIFVSIFLTKRWRKRKADSLSRDSWIGNRLVSSRVNSGMTLPISPSEQPWAEAQYNEDLTTAHSYDDLLAMRPVEARLDSVSLPYVQTSAPNFGMQSTSEVHSQGPTSSLYSPYHNRSILADTASWSPSAAHFSPYSLLPRIRISEATTEASQPGDRHSMSTIIPIESPVDNSTLASNRSRAENVLASQRAVTSNPSQTIPFRNEGSIFASNASSSFKVPRKPVQPLGRNDPSSPVTPVDNIDTFIDLPSATSARTSVISNLRSNSMAQRHWEGELSLRSFSPGPASPRYAR